jgi:hypothetical protein
MRIPAERALKKHVSPSAETKGLRPCRTARQGLRVRVLRGTGRGHSKTQLHSCAAFGMGIAKWRARIGDFQAKVGFDWPLVIVQELAGDMRSLLDRGTAIRELVSLLVP